MNFEQAPIVADLQEHRDRTLFGAMSQGDHDAFAELFRRYGPAGLGLAVRVLRDKALAEEVLQDVFLAVWRNPAQYDPARGSVRSWLLTRVHHRAVDVVRSEQAERGRASKQDLPAPEREVEDVIEESWIAAKRTKMREAMAQLPDEQRSVIELTYFDGMTQTQVASHAGIPLGTVKSRTLAAMQRLRRSMGGDV